MKRNKKILVVCVLSGSMVASSTVVYGAKALQMQSNFVVNNEKFNITAYTIEGNNYFKLRDLAMVLKGTGKEFEVEWNPSLNAINLIEGQAYTIEGSELFLGKGTNQEAEVSLAQVYKGDKPVNLSAYRIGDSNYFKLRELGELLDVNIAWIGETNTVKVEIPRHETETEELIVIQRDALSLPVKKIGAYPMRQEEYENILLNMMENNLETYEIAYNSQMYDCIESGQLQEIIKAAYTEVFARYIEQFGSIEGLGLNINGNGTSGIIELKLQPINGYSLKLIKGEFLKGCSSIVNELINEGKLTSSMTDKEKAKVLYEWVVSNIATDAEAAEISRSGYGAITNKKAVCQGYTAVYNTLCKLVGIEARGVVGTAGTTPIDHSWTLALLDGEKVYVDITYAALLSEKKGVCDFRYFMASEEFLSNDHYWDKNIKNRP